MHEDEELMYEEYMVEQDKMYELLYMQEEAQVVTDELPQFSFFKKPILNTTPLKKIDLVELYNIIKEPLYKDRTEFLRSKSVKKEADEYKRKQFDYVTFSGTFSKRSEMGLTEHSGLICMDFDKLPNLVTLKEDLLSDVHTVMLFVSPSGDGLKWLIRIDPNKNHKEQFDAIENYAKNKYDAKVDDSCKDTCRACFLPHDPDVFLHPNILNEGNISVVPVFDMELHKVNRADSELNIINGMTLFKPRNLSKKGIENARKMIANAVDGEKNKELLRASNLLGGYVGGGMLEKEEAIEILRDEISKKDNVLEIDKAFQTIDKGVTHGMLSPITQESQEKYLGNKKSQVPKGKKDDENPFLLGLHYIAEMRHVVRNEITDRLEENGKCFSDLAINSLYIKAYNIGIPIAKSGFDILIGSDHIPSYHPIKDFFENNKNEIAFGYIDKLCNSVISDMNLELKKTFITKWLVGMVASVFDNHYNPLMLVLIGGKNIGKTEFFRRLLPTELMDYFAQSKFDAGKDSEALMCEKLLIMNDELDALSKYEAKTFRNFISSDKYTYRPPYGKQNVTKKRLATVCGTSNEDNIINDWENNRRIIPIKITAINHELYNSINKTSLLMEALQLFHNNFQWALTKEDIDQLAEYSVDFKALNIESELLAGHFTHGQKDGLITEYLTTTEILNILELETKQKLNIKILGSELRQHGFIQQSKRVDGQPKKVYEVMRQTKT